MVLFYSCYLYASGSCSHITVLKEPDATRELRLAVTRTIMAFKRLSIDCVLKILWLLHTSDSFIEKRRCIEMALTCKRNSTDGATVP